MLFQSTIKKLSVFTAGLCLLALAPPSHAACLKYGDVVNIKFNSNGKYMMAGPAGAMLADRPAALEWERYLIMGSQGHLSDSNVNYGDEISFLSYHDQFLRANPNGTVVATEPDVQAWELWTVTKNNGWTPSNSNRICADSSDIALKSNHGKYLSEETVGQNALPVNKYANVSALTFEKINWTDFYYSRHFPKRGASTTGPGTFDYCAFRGKYDGGNCFIAKSTGSGPSIWQHNFYYLNSGQGCALGTPAGGNCQVGQNPPSATPFIYAGKYYIKKAITPPASPPMRRCKEYLTISSTPMMVLSNSDAVQYAKRRWEEQVYQLYGQEFDSWGTVHSNTSPGPSIACQSGTKRWACTARAAPCDRD